MPTDNAPTLFNMTPRCIACGDLGLELDKGGMPVRCWRMQTGIAHNEPSPAAQMIGRSLESLFRAKVTVDQHTLDVVKTLMRYTAKLPCKKERVIEGHFGYTPSSLRHFHQTVETLRKVWLLPVGSRKESPSGYWIITDIDDFADWVDRAKSAPITQLTTIHRVAKRNFPVFAEQMELDFWRDIELVRLDAAA